MDDVTAAVLSDAKAAAEAAIKAALAKGGSGTYGKLLQPFYASWSSLCSLFICEANQMVKFYRQSFLNRPSCDMSLLERLTPFRSLLNERPPLLQTL